MQQVCQKHGTYEAEVFETFGIKIISNCPICEKLEEESERRKEAAEKERYRIERMQAHGIEKEHQSATFDNYRAETTSEKEALEATKALAAGSIKKLILLGQNGVGKTHLACALVRKMGGMRITMFELSARIRAGYNNGQSELTILDKLLTEPLIVLDEIGRTKGSDAEKNWLSYLLDKAHSRGIPLLLISNRQKANSLPPERRSEAFENYFDNDVISRLRQNSRIVEVHGRDRRAGA